MGIPLPQSLGQTSFGDRTLSAAELGTFASSSAPLPSPTQQDPTLHDQLDWFTKPTNLSVWHFFNAESSTRLVVAVRCSFYVLSGVNGTCVAVNSVDESVSDTLVSWAQESTRTERGGTFTLVKGASTGGWTSEAKDNVECLRVH